MPPLLAPATHAQLFFLVYTHTQTHTPYYWDHHHQRHAASLNRSTLNSWCAIWELRGLRNVVWLHLPQFPQVMRRNTNSSLAWETVGLREEMKFLTQNLARYLSLCKGKRQSTFPAPPPTFVAPGGNPKCCPQNFSVSDGFTFINRPSFLTSEGACLLRL